MLKQPRSSAIDQDRGYCATTLLATSVYPLGYSLVLSFLRFRLVVLPLALPGLAVTAIFAFVFAWNEFLYASMLTSFNAKTLPVVISGYISDKFLRWGEMSALGTAVVLPVVLFSAFVQRYLVRGLTFGAVKE